MPRTSLDTHVDPRSNGLNLVRLVLAASVIFWHSYPLTGHPAFPSRFFQPLASSFAVDGFFVISGFLLFRSWQHSPRLWAFVRNRALRILPGYWCALLFVAVVAAPVAALLQQRSVADLFSGRTSAQHYVAANSLLTVRQQGIAGTPVGVPYGGTWNGSLWTLRWEAAAYAGLAFLGVTRLLRTRWVVPALTGLVWLVTAGLAFDLLPANYWVGTGARLGLMFLMGMLIAQFAGRLPAGRSWPVIAAVLLLASPLLPDYRLIGAPALGYLVLWLGGRVHRPSLQLRNRDISYGVYVYAFPIQQVLATTVLVTLPPLVFGLLALIVVVPVAALSWTLVERPALRLKSLRRRRSVDSTVVPVTAAVAPVAPSAAAPVAAAPTATPPVVVLPPQRVSPDAAPRPALAGPEN